MQYLMFKIEYNELKDLMLETLKFKLSFGWSEINYYFTFINVFNKE